MKGSSAIGSGSEAAMHATKKTGASIAVCENLVIQSADDECQLVKNPVAVEEVHYRVKQTKSWDRRYLEN
ncbi:MAG TPA: hypothetical protein VMS18_02800 [Candidatus Binatia bacterium]|nr:hypothetical protein [Candidatus Binatia bacterium]